MSLAATERNAASPDLSHRDRVSRAIRFEKPDRTPRDFAAAPEIWQALGSYFGAGDREQILRRLGIDCRIVSYDSFCSHPDLSPDHVDMNASRERSSLGGMWRFLEPDGYNRDIWGARRRRVENAFGALDQIASYPLGGAKSTEDLRRYRWPEPDWWDFRQLQPAIARLNQDRRYHIRYRAGSVFETAWSLYGLERTAVELVSDPERPVYIMERIAEIHIENLRRVLECAGDLIDIVYFYDDMASQERLMISPKLYARHIQPFHLRLIELARKFGKPVMMHCCGSSFNLIPALIEMGLAVINPVQPLAKGMEPERLRDAFGGRIAFHGGVDVQRLLPNASPSEVRERVAYVSEVLGSSGGYIRAGSHHIQADTPVQNILAMYSVE